MSDMELDVPCRQQIKVFLLKKLIWSLEDLGIRFSHMKNDQDG
jgi:hypothetical protein